MRYFVMEIGSARRVGYVTVDLVRHPRSTDLRRLRMLPLFSGSIPVFLDDHVSALTPRWIWVRPFDAWRIETHPTFEGIPKRRVEFRKRRQLAPAVGTENPVYATR